MQGNNNGPSVTPNGIGIAVAGFYASLQKNVTTIEHRSNVICGPTRPAPAS